MWSAQLGRSSTRRNPLQNNSNNAEELAQQAREAYETWEKGFDPSTKTRFISPSYNKAIALFRQAIELEPNNAKWHSQLAMALGWIVFGSDDGEYAGWASTNRDNETKSRFLYQIAKLNEIKICREK